MTFTWEHYVGRKSSPMLSFGTWSMNQCCAAAHICLLSIYIYKLLAWGSSCQVSQQGRNMATGVPRFQHNGKCLRSLNRRPSIFIKHFPFKCIGRKKFRYDITLVKTVQTKTRFLVLLLSNTRNKLGTVVVIDGPGNMWGWGERSNLDQDREKWMELLLEK